MSDDNEQFIKITLISGQLNDNPLFEGTRASGLGGYYHQPQRHDESPPDATKGIYLLFAWWDGYEPCGGAKDFVGAYDTIQQAMEAMPSDNEGGHICVWRDKDFHMVMWWDDVGTVEDGIRKTGWRRITPDEPEN